MADLLLGSLAADGRGPSRLRVLPNFATEGADCPAVLLECGTLGRNDETRRLVTPNGIRDLAVSLARAVERYAHGEALAMKLERLGRWFRGLSAATLVLLIVALAATADSSTGTCRAARRRSRWRRGGEVALPRGTRVGHFVLRLGFGRLAGRRAATDPRDASG